MNLYRWWRSIGFAFASMSGLLMVVAALGAAGGWTPPLAAIFGPIFGADVDFTALAAGIAGALLTAWMVTVVGLELPQPVRGHVAFGALLLWFGLDSATSVVTGAHLNAALNVVYLLAVLPWVLPSAGRAERIERRLDGLDLSDAGPLLVRHEVTVAADPAMVFEASLDPARLAAMAPFLRSATYEVVPTLDREGLRVCRLTGGGTVRERFVCYEPPHRYAYRAEGSSGLRQHLSVWRFDAVPDGTRVRVLVFGQLSGWASALTYVFIRHVTHRVLARLSREAFRTTPDSPSPRPQTSTTA
jgi:uncharacterized protein YndB with AHSA1/START domain